MTEPEQTHRDWQQASETLRLQRLSRQSSTPTWPRKLQAIAVLLLALAAWAAVGMLAWGAWEAWQAYDGVRDYLRELVNSMADANQPELDSNGYPVPPCDPATGEFC